jgi:hypothetical protein
MLLKLSVHISNCLQLAAQAEQLAKETTDPAIRSDNEQLAQSWRHLAASYQFVESLEHFLSDKERNEADAAPPPLALIAEVAPPESRPIIRRPRVKQTLSFKDRLLKTAQEASEQAAGLPPVKNVIVCSLKPGSARPLPKLAIGLQLRGQGRPMSYMISLSSRSVDSDHFWPEGAWPFVFASALLASW